MISVSDKDISVKMKSSGEVLRVPHGLILWSTGVGTRPVISDLMEQVGQGGRRALATNEWLQVKGCENVYAVGDCASIAQRKIMVCKPTIRLSILFLCFHICILNLNMFCDCFRRILQIYLKLQM